METLWQDVRYGLRMLLKKPGLAATVVLAIVALGTTSLPARGQAVIGGSAPDFKLQDQYDKPFALAETRGRVVLLVYGDRHGNAYMGNYTKAVRQRFGGGSDGLIRSIPIANLRGVPGFMRGLVKGRFHGTTSDGRPKSPVLLDWSGTVARLYGFRDELTNIYLVDQQGGLRYKAAGRGTPEETTALLSAINQLLGSQ